MIGFATQILAGLPWRCIRSGVVCCRSIAGGCIPDLCFSNGLQTCFGGVGLKGAEPHDSPGMRGVLLSLIYKTLPLSGFWRTSTNRETPGGGGWMSKEIGDGGTLGHISRILRRGL